MTDLAARAAAIAAQGRARQVANRAAAPVIAAWWDGWSAVFTFAAIDLTDPTTGRRWRRGDMTPDTGRSMNADEWLAYVHDPNPRPLGFQMERL